MLYLKADVTIPLSFISCGQFANSGWIHEKRTIDSFEVIYGIKGCAYIQQDAEQYAVTPGQALLLLPGHPHRGYRESEEEVSFYWMHFRCADGFELLADKAAQSLLYPLASNAYLNSASSSVLIPGFFKPAESERLVILIKQLLHCANSQKSMALTNHYLLTLILMELSQQAISTLPPQGGYDKTFRKFAEMNEWLRVNIGKEFTVEEIAVKFNFNKDYLCRLFKKHTGMPLIKYINGLKIAKAKELLCCSALSVKEIAYTLGYKDEKYFMKLFKSFENLTPSAYRSSYYLTHMNNA